MRYKHYLDVLLITISSSAISASFCTKDRVLCDHKNVCLVLDCDYNYKTIYSNFVNNTETYGSSHRNTACNQTDECLPVSGTAPLESQSVAQIDVTHNSAQMYASSAAPTKCGDHMCSAQFSPSYDSIWISCLYLIQPQGLIDCHNLFDGPSLLSLGSDPECTVIANELVITLRTGSTVSPEDLLVFATNDSIKLVKEVDDSEQSPQSAEPFSTVREISGLNAAIESPISEVMPFFTIDGSHQLCYTEDTNQSKLAIIQINNIIGNSGQPLKLTWIVNIIANPEQNNTNLTQQAQIMIALLPNVIIPNTIIELNPSLLIPGLTYELTVIGENRFGRRSIPLEYRIGTNSEFKSFLISINGLTAIDISVDNVFAIDISICFTNNFTYTLNNFEIMAELILDNETIIKQDKNIFYIPANTLIGGMSYQLKAIAQYLDTNETDVYVHEFSTILRPLMAVIDREYLKIERNSSFLLNGSASYDQNNGRQPLRYQWSCVQINSASSDCNLNNKVNMSSAILQISPESSQQLTGNLYKFALTVSTPDRDSTASVIVELSDKKVPSLQLKNTWNKPGNKVNPKNAQYLTYTVGSEDNIKTIATHSTNNCLNKNHQVTFDTFNKSIIAKSTKWQVLKISEPYTKVNWFGLDFNKLYKFTITAISDLGESSVDSIVFKTNDPPLAGYLQVVLITTMRFLCKYRISSYGWTDADYPLKYTFYYKHPNDETPTTLAVSIGQPNSIEAFLPVTDLELTVGVKVCDVFGMCSVKENAVLVESDISAQDSTSLTLQTVQDSIAIYNDPVNSIAFITALLQMLSLNENIEVDNEVILQIDRYLSKLIDSVISDGYKNPSTIESLSRLLSSSYYRFIYSRSTPSLIPKILALKRHLIDKQQELSNRSPDDDIAKTIVYLDQALLQFNAMNLMELLTDLTGQLSAKCTDLANPTQIYEQNTDLIYCRVDYHQFLPTIVDNNSDNNSLEFIRIAGKVRLDLGNYMTLDKNTVGSLADWQCGQQTRCSGVCIASSQFNLPEITKIIGQKSPLIFISLYSPITGRQMLDHLISVPNNSVTFILPINSNDTINLRCARLDQVKMAWQTDLCKTIYHSNMFLICECYQFGYFGAIDNNVPPMESPVAENTTITTTDSTEQNMTDSPVSVASNQVIEQTGQADSNSVANETKEVDTESVSTSAIDSGSDGNITESSVTESYIEDSNSSQLVEVTTQTPESANNKQGGGEHIQNFTSATITTTEPVNTTETSTSPNEQDNNYCTSNSTQMTEVTTQIPQPTNNEPAHQDNITSTATTEQKDSATSEQGKMTETTTLPNEQDYNSNSSIDSIIVTTQSTETASKELGDLNNVTSVDITESNTLPSEQADNVDNSTQVNDKTTATTGLPDSPLETPSTSSEIINDNQTNNSTRPSAHDNPDNSEHNDLANITESIDTTVTESIASITPNVTEIEQDSSTSPAEDSTGTTKITDVASTQSQDATTSSEQNVTDSSPISETATNQDQMTTDLSSGNQTTTSPSSEQPAQTETAKETIQDTTEEPALPTPNVVVSGDNQVKSDRHSISGKFFIDADFDEFVDNRIDETRDHLIGQLLQTFSLPDSCVMQLSITSGSVVLDVNITSEQQLAIETVFPNEDFHLTDLKGRQFVVSRTKRAKEPEVTTTQQTVSSSTRPTKPSTKGSTQVMVSKPTKPSDLVTESLPNSSRSSVTTSPMDMTTTTDSATKSPVVVSMTITIEGDYDTMVGGDKLLFLSSMKRQLANYLRVPLTSIVHMDSKPGSIVVFFELIPSVDPNFSINHEAIKAAKEEFEKKIRSNKVFIFDWDGKPHAVLSSMDNTDNIGHKTENSANTHTDSYLILGLAVGAVVFMIAIIIITGCAVRSYMYRKYLRTAPRPHSSDGQMSDNPSRDGIPSRILDALTREGANSSGHYSYDSGVWVGAGSEPDLSVRGVPDRPVYKPPNEMQISITPKPPPEVIMRLKKDWSDLKGSDSPVPTNYLDLMA